MDSELRAQPDVGADPPIGRSGGRHLFQVVAVLVAALVVAGTALGIFDGFTLLEALGVWRDGVLFAIGFVLIIAYVHFYTRRAAWRARHDEAERLANRNAQRIAELKRKLEASKAA